MFKKDDNSNDVTKNVHQMYRKRYGLFWRFHRNTIVLDELTDKLNKNNEILMELSKHIKKQNQQY